MWNTLFHIISSQFFQRLIRYSEDYPIYHQEVSRKQRYFKKYLLYASVVYAEQLPIFVAVSIK